MKIIIPTTAIRITHPNLQPRRLPSRERIEGRNIQSRPTLLFVCCYCLFMGRVGRSLVSCTLCCIVLRILSLRTSLSDSCRIESHPGGTFLNTSPLTGDEGRPQQFTMTHQHKITATIESNRSHRFLSINHEAYYPTINTCCRRRIRSAKPAPSDDQTLHE